MPGPARYGTAAFKSSARKPPGSAANAGLADGTPAAPIFAPKGIAETVATTARIGSAASMRSKAPRFKEPAPRTGVVDANTYAKPGVAERPLHAGKGAVAFRQREPRFVDPSHPVRLPGALDSDTPVLGLADMIARRSQGTAAFKTAPRFRVKKDDDGISGQPTTPIYAPPSSVANMRHVVDMTRSHTPRFVTTPSPTAAVDLWVPPGLADKAARAKSPSPFALASIRFKTMKPTGSTSAPPPAYVPPAFGIQTVGGAVAAFRGPERFKESPRRSGGADTSSHDVVLAIEDSATPSRAQQRAASPGSVPFRSVSPRFRPSLSETVNAEFTAPAGMGAAAAAGGATAAFRSKSPRIPEKRQPSVDAYPLPSFVDDILRR